MTLEAQVTVARNMMYKLRIKGHADSVVQEGVRKELSCLSAGIPAEY
jgi:hypothetical protein